MLQRPSLSFQTAHSAQAIDAAENIGVCANQLKQARKRLKEARQQLVGLWRKGFYSVYLIS